MLETIAHYLALLEDAYLFAALQKFSPGAHRRRQAPPKLVALSNAILAVTDPRGVPDRAAEPDRFGKWVENACLAQAWNAGQAVTYWREEPLEVDAVLEGSWGAWVLEVKTGSYGMRDLAGLLEFARRHRRFRPLVVCAEGNTGPAERAGVRAVSWREFVWSGLAGEQGDPVTPPASR